MSLENFSINTLIIPMDTTYQNNGMFKAYGLVYNLLLNKVPVKWAIQSGKAFDGTDFTASAVDVQSSAFILNHNYTGGPFIIDSAYEATAMPFITVWQTLYPNVKVHRATSPFTADIAATMRKAPVIAVESANSGIMINYLNMASIPDSSGNVWSNTSTGILTETEIANGALFGNDLSQCRRIAYDIFLSPHTGEKTWDDPNLKIELNDYLYQGGYLHATCESIPSIENTAGPFLTQSGMPTTDTNGGDAGTFNVDVPDFPSAQSVSTGLVQGLPGGSFQTVYHLTPGLSYNSQTQILAHFVETKTSKQYDFMMAGPYKNGAGAGKIIYEGGHNYSPSLPYTGNMENLYYRFVLDSVFFSVSKPLMFLEYSPTTIYQNVVNKITFSIVNTGASPSLNTGFSVTLVPGMTYNNDATILPTNISGQTLTWSSAALGNVLPGTILTFTADFSPAGTGPTKLADFSASFGDEFNETYSFEHCIKGNVTTFTRANLQITKAVDNAYAAYGDTLTYTATITNSGTLTAANVVFFDQIPLGTTFVPGSVTVAVPPAAPSPVAGNPSLGIPLPNIPAVPAAGSTVIVSFKVIVNDMTTPEDVINQSTTNYSFTNTEGTFNAVAESNIVTTIIELGKLTALKSVDKSIAAIGDTLTYTVIVTNIGTVIANNVTFTDSPPSGTSFVTGSVTVDGSPVSGSPITGISLGNMSPLNSKTVSFKVSVVSIPTPQIATNTSDIAFSYRINPQGPDIPGLTVSNPVSTNLVKTTLSVVKTTDKTSADIGETVTFTLTVTNTGDITADNVILTDPIPLGTSFVSGSVTVNGIPVSGNPSSGILLNSISPNGTAIVTFKVTINSIPSPNPTPNSAIVNGTFTVSQTEPPKSLDFTSNTVYVEIENAMLSAVKSVNKSFAEVSDTLIYTIVITNTGTVAANNTVFTDSPPNGTVFVPGSITVNGIPVSGSPITGIPLGSIMPSASSTITFNVTVNSIPSPNPAINFGIINADFPVNPQSPVHKTFNTNDVSTKVETASLNVLKSVNKAFAEVGEDLIYTITVSNNGTVSANNTVVTDNTPNGITFVPGTVTINGISNATANPNSGIAIGTIAAGGSVVIKFNAHVDFIPSPNPAGNVSLASASFPVDPNKPVSKNFTSNPAYTRIEIAQLTLVKTTDKPIVQIGDTVTYSIFITNTGTVPANNVVFKDAVPKGTSFIPGSVTINGLPSLLSDVTTGINLGTIAPGAVIVITFKVNIDSVPSPNPTINTASGTALFPVDPENPTEKNFESNPIPVEIKHAELQINKQIDMPFAEVSDTVTYTIIIKNTGTVSADNIIFTDNPPPGTTFIPGSVTVNGVSVSQNPSSGVPIGTITAGSTVTVTFKVSVTSVPSPNPTINTGSVNGDFIIDPTKPPINLTFTSNEVPLTAVLSRLNVVKSVNKDAAIVGDTLTYTVTITNAGNVNADNVTLYDIVPSGTVFVPNSLTINGISKSGINPMNGVTIETLNAGASVVVSFNVTITSMPLSSVAVNNATVEFEYIVNPQNPPKSKTEKSNDVTTRIETINLTLVKSSNKTYVIKNDIIIYTVVITNNGTVALNNVIFKDEIPDGTSFVKDSLTIGGVPVPSANPEEGVNLGSISPKGTVTVGFSVRFDYMPCPAIIKNIASAVFNYRLSSSGPIENGSSESNETETKAAIINFKQLSIDENLTIPAEKPDAEDILNTTADVSIISTRVITTTKGTSKEGQILTGFKLIIEGMLNQKIEYVADEPTQKVHTAEFNVPFSSFIVLPENFVLGTTVNVIPYIEDIYVKLLDKRTIFKNVTLRLEAEFIC